MTNSLWNATVTKLEIDTMEQNSTANRNATPNHSNAVQLAQNSN